MSEPKVGQVWRDLDPRGGPTFRIEAIEPARGSVAARAVVVNLDGKRRRRIRLDRIRHGKRGYGLVSS